MTLLTADAHLTFFSLLVTSLFFFLKANEKLILLNLKPPYRIFFTKYRTVIDFFFPPFFILTDVVYLHWFFIVEKIKQLANIKRVRFAHKLMHVAIWLIACNIYEDTMWHMMVSFCEAKFWWILWWCFLVFLSNLVLRWIL